METITSADKIGFLSDSDIEYHIDLIDAPDYYLIVRKNKILGTVVIQRVSEAMMSILESNRGMAEEIRAVMLQNMINSEWRIVDAHSGGRGV